MLIGVILGAFLVTVGVTLLSGISEILSTLTSWVNASIGHKIALHSAEISKIQQANSSNDQVQAIGFHISN